MTSSTENNIYRITNAVFNSPVGRASYQDPNDRFQPIVGTDFDTAAFLRFNVYYTTGDRVVFYIDQLPIGVSNNILYAFADTDILGDEFIVEFISEANFRRLYRICLASNPDLAWTLNSAEEPANKVFLSQKDSNNHRQLWDLAYQPY